MKYSIRIWKTKRWVWKANIYQWEPEFVPWYRFKQPNLYTEIKELTLDILFEKIKWYELKLNIKF